MINESTAYPHPPKSVGSVDPYCIYELNVGGGGLTGGSRGGLTLN